MFGMESYLPTSDRHAASWIFSDGPGKQLGVVQLRYNALKLNSRSVYTNVVTRVGGSVGRLNPTTVVQMYRSKR